MTQLPGARRRRRYNPVPMFAPDHRAESNRQIGQQDQSAGPEEGADDA